MRNNLALSLGWGRGALASWGWGGLTGWGWSRRRWGWARRWSWRSRGWGWSRGGWRRVLGALRWEVRHKLLHVEGDRADGEVAVTWVLRGNSLNDLLTGVADTHLLVLVRGWQARWWDEGEAARLLLGAALSNVWVRDERGQLGDLSEHVTWGGVDGSEGGHGGDEEGLGVHCAVGGGLDRLRANSGVSDEEEHKRQQAGRGKAQRRKTQRSQTQTDQRPAHGGGGGGACRGRAKIPARPSNPSQIPSRASRCGDNRAVPQWSWWHHDAPERIPSIVGHERCIKKARRRSHPTSLVVSLRDRLNLVASENGLIPTSTKRDWS